MKCEGRIVLGTLVAGTLLLAQGYLYSYSDRTAGTTSASGLPLAFSDAAPIGGGGLVAEAAGTPIGQGCTTAYYIDQDCDGYGPGVRASGAYGIATFAYVGVGDKPDADDTSPTLNSPATVLAAYDANGNGTLDTSELKKFLLERRGYRIDDVFYVSRTGNNATGAANNPNLPYASFVAGVQRVIGPGDAMIFKAGTYPEPGIGGGAPTLSSGTSGNPVVYMTMPGEVVALTTASSSAFSTTDVGAFASWVIIDGFTVEHPTRSGWGLGNGWSCADARNSIIRNIETARFAYVNCIGGNALMNLTVERSIFHHQREHGFYMGSNYTPASGVTVQDNIFYANGWDPDDGDMGGGYGGFQFNGRCTGCTFSRNISHSNGAWGMSLIEGVTGAVVANNLIFNNATYGIILQIYEGSCPALGTGDSGTCPYDTNNNLFINNTIWVGTTRADGLHGSGLYPEPFAAIGVARNTNSCVENGVSAPAVRCTMEQTFRNNIIHTVTGTAFYFAESAAVGDKWMDDSVFENNVVYKTNGTDIARKESTFYTFAQFESAFGGTNRNADPLFVRALFADYASPGLFSLRLQPTSPARSFGATAGAPSTDLAGVVRAVPPDAGAYQFSGSGTSAKPKTPTGLRIIK